MKYNNIELDTVIYNNTDLDKVTYNGVEVFSKNNWDGVIVSNSVIVPNPDFFTYSGTNKLSIDNGTVYFIVKILDISAFNSIIFSASGSTSFPDH